MKTQSLWQILIIICIILYFTIVLSIEYKTPPTIIKDNEPIVTEHKNFNDYCDTHDCLLGK